MTRDTSYTALLAWHAAPDLRLESGAQLPLRAWVRGPGRAPMACDTCCTSAPVASQRAEMLFMLLMRCASMALAVSLVSSADQRLVSRMRSRGTQCAYTSASTSIALRPLSVSLPPIKTYFTACTSVLTLKCNRFQVAQLPWLVGHG